MLPALAYVREQVERLAQTVAFGVVAKTRAFPTVAKTRAVPQGNIDELGADLARRGAGLV